MDKNQIKPLIEEQLITSDKQELVKKSKSAIERFLHKHEKDLSKEFKSLQNGIQEVKLTILQLEQIQQAAEQIKLNRLVAFPTETVFGLGANALSEKALLDIYKVKKRPLTDPIIVHVLDFQQAKQLVQITQKQEALAKVLTDKFWPGPLTVIMKANLDILPAVVTAQTGFVGIRSPRHPYARNLIEISQRPIGAPSANLFAHVSPTSSVHVFNDFYNQDISLVDGDRCEFGIESTVVKIVEENDKVNIHVLREGSLSVERLRQFVNKQYANHKVIPEVSINARVKQQKQNMEAPGQLLKHYSPYLPCYFSSEPKLLNQEKSQFPFGQVAMMAFNQNYSVHSKKFKYYFQVEKDSTVKERIEDLKAQQSIFCSSEEQAAMRNLYYMLRHCENLDCKAILIGWSGPKTGTIWDKVFRATEGKELNH